MTCRCAIWSNSSNGSSAMRETLCGTNRNQTARHAKLWTVRVFLRSDGNPRWTWRRVSAWFTKIFGGDLLGYERGPFSLNLSLILNLRPNACGSCHKAGAIKIKRVINRTMSAMVKQSEPPMPSNEPDAWLTAPCFAATLGLLVFATFPGVLLGQTTFVVRDYGIFSYPAAYFQQQCFWRSELPLWDP